MKYHNSMRDACAVPDFDSLSKQILDPVNQVFFNCFRDRFVKFTAPESTSPHIAYDLLPRLRADCFFVRVAALRWPALVKTERSRMWPFYPIDTDLDDERENYKQFLLELGVADATPRSFSSASSVILDRIWNTDIPLNISELINGIPNIEDADVLLARELLDVARLLEVDAEASVGFEGNCAFDENFCEMQCTNAHARTDAVDVPSFGKWHHESDEDDWRIADEIPDDLYHVRVQLQLYMPVAHLPA